MANKDLQKKRILIYFIEAAQEIMKKEGISNITIRRVAQSAGYNSATLYNYFEDLDHLILYASLKYLHLYTAEVTDAFSRCNGEREFFLQMWESFCRISFQYPEPFERIFFCKHSDRLESVCQKYYELFPEECPQPSDNLYPIFSSIQLDYRNRLALERLDREELRPDINLDLVNDLLIFSYHELLHRCSLNPPKNREEVQMYTDRMFTYINYLVFPDSKKEESHEQSKEN